MSKNNHIEHIFQIFDSSCTYISEQFNKNYLEALIDTGEQLFQGEMVLETTDIQRKRLEKIYREFQEDQYTQEDVRRAFQLATLKGLKEHTVPGTGVTPDAVVMFMGYLAKQLSPHPSSVLDLAVGSGNLLTGILNQYEEEIQAVATEVDSTLVRLAYVNANLQQHAMDIFHQDGLKPLYTSASALTVCDLPVGLYPNKKVAKDYELYDEQDLYTHHLLIEQSLRLTQPDGYLMFLIPNAIFSEPGAQKLRSFIMGQSHIQALLQLPEDMFQKGSIHKSIFILQKKGENSTKPKETLLAQLPSFSDAQKFSATLTKINNWIKTEKV
ncbi:class I SAM-dependent methyltransferase [Caldalkalibacillus salinus]|uniref:class I SAM-dependent methyltransferase n=1 Tax=Caldalkalibacillus salinus TaxID=2803787 RepID=UPI001924E81C|nr:class I SAM-dependent methyltransferase [Caldalkalibacillus salinus]